MGKPTLSKKRLDELEENKVKVMDVIIACAMAELEVADMARIAMGEPALLKDTQRLYDEGMAVLLAKTKPENWELEKKTAMANLAQAAFMSNICPVLGVDVAEVKHIFNQIEGIEMENRVKDLLKDKFKVTQTQGGVH